METATVLVWLVVIGSAIWVAADASRLGVSRGCLGGGMFDMGPAGWFFAVLLLWIVGLPAYLVTRDRYARISRAKNAAGGAGARCSACGQAVQSHDSKCPTCGARLVWR